MKKVNIRFLSSVFVLCAFGISGANAAPSVKMLGANSARVGSNVNVVKTSNVKSDTQGQQRLGSVRTKTITAGAPVSVKKTTNTISSSDAEDTARLGLGKYIHSTGIASGAVKPTGTTAGVSSTDFINLKDQVDDLKDSKQNVLTAGDGLVLDDDTLSLDSAVVQAQVDYALDDYYTKDEIDSKVADIVVGDVSEVLDGKQDTITDLESIRSGATAGATAVQPDSLNTTLNDYLTTANAATTYQPKGDYATVAALGAKADADTVYTKSEVDTKVANIVAGDVSEALSGKQDTITDLASIRSGATAGATAVQPDSLNTTLNDYLTTANAATTYQPKGDYATVAALGAKADASELNNYLTTANASTTYQPKGDYATVAALGAKADASELNNYLTTANAATTYQPKGTYVNNPDLPTTSGDFMLVVNRDENGNYTYSWESVPTGGGNSGSGDTGGGWTFDDSNW